MEAIDSEELDEMFRYARRENERARQHWDNGEKLDLPPIPAGRRRSKYDWSQLRYMVERGMTNEEIAVVIGCSPLSVQTAKKREGLTKQVGRRPGPKNRVFGALQ